LVIIWLSISNLISLAHTPEVVKVLNQPVQQGEEVILHYQTNESSPGLEPQNLPINIIYEDEDILVVNKPAGQVVHPTLGYVDGTLANGIAYHWQQQGRQHTVRLVNRLDRNTSGLVLVACNELAHHKLVQQFEKGAGIKRYYALVEGWLEPEAGTISLPIGLAPDSIIKRQVTPEGKDAITKYKTLAKLKEASLLEVELVTGRTHQIRVHFAHCGHSLIGDTFYGSESYYGVLTRHGLHAYSLEFDHPKTGRLISFSAPIPDDLTAAIKKLSLT